MGLFPPPLSQIQRLSPSPLILPEFSVSVPPHRHVLAGLTRHSNYSARVSCVNEVGASPFSPWMRFLTPESGDPPVSGSGPRRASRSASRKALRLSSQYPPRPLGI